MSVRPIPGCLTVSEAANKVGVSTWSIYREIREGKLRAKRIGRCVRILDEELARWLRSDD